MIGTLHELALVLFVGAAILGCAVFCGCTDGKAGMGASPTTHASAPQASSPTGAEMLCRVKLLSDVEPDMTSVQTILGSILKPGMSDEEKCLAIFWFVNDHRFWYPTFYGKHNDLPAYDPAMVVNCFPALICQQDAAIVSGLWAAAGFDVRYWQLGRHTTAEVFYDGKWRNFDPTSGRLFHDADDGVGGVETTSQKKFYTPGKSELIAFDDYTIGHEMNLSLRKGERFTRYWRAIGDGQDYWLPSNSPDKRADARADNPLGLHSTIQRKPYTFDTGGAGVANGLWEFKPDFTIAGWEKLFDIVSGVKADTTGWVRPAAAGKAGEVVLRVTNPYPITGAWLEGEFNTAGGELKVLISTDNGINWNEVSMPVGADARRKLPLREFVSGKFGYLLKVTMKGPAADGPAFKGIATQTVVQVNPLSLPALKNGRTQLRVSAGEQLETITLSPNLSTADYRKEIFAESNIVTRQEGGLEAWFGGLNSATIGKESWITYKVTAPGDIKTVRWGGRFKTGTGQINQMLYSVDGKNWKTQELSNRWAYPNSPVKNAFTSYYETTGSIPPCTRSVYLKYRFERPGGMRHLATSLRMDVDYAPQAAGVTALPMEVTYCWDEEDGGKMVEKTQTEVVRRLPYSYSILVNGKEKPLMKWVRTRLIDAASAPARIEPQPPKEPGNMP